MTPPGNGDSPDGQDASGQDANGQDANGQGADGRATNGGATNGSGGKARAEQPPILSIVGLRTQFGPSVIHDNLDFSVQPGEVMGVVGGSGTGKSVLIRTIIGLNKPTAGRITVFGRDLASLSAAETTAMQSRWGVLFQDGALFSSLTVAQNIEVPMKEHSDLPPELRRELIDVKISMVGLPPDAAHKYPAELSGGMRKRAGLARALALDADILFLDEPTAGLDPNRRGQLRHPDRRPAARPGADGRDGDSRSGLALRHLRPGFRAGEQTC